MPGASAIGVRRTAVAGCRGAAGADEWRRRAWKSRTNERKMIGMLESAAPAMRTGYPRESVWRRLGCALVLALGIALLLRSQWTQGISPLLRRTVLLGLVGVLVFGLFERWPKRLPQWLPRWVLQVVGVGAAMPATTVAVYLLSTRAGAPEFWRDPDRMEGWMMLTLSSDCTTNASISTMPRSRWQSRTCSASAICGGSQSNIPATPCHPTSTVHQRPSQAILHAYC